MRSNGKWGDDVEIQAISELYNITAQIYIYGSRPSKSFHEEGKSSNIIKLSYHYNSHYNLLVGMK